MSLSLVSPSSKLMHSNRRFFKSWFSWRSTSNSSAAGAASAALLYVQSNSWNSSSMENFLSLILGLRMKLLHGVPRGVNPQLVHGDPRGVNDDDVRDPNGNDRDPRPDRSSGAGLKPDRSRWGKGTAALATTSVEGSFLKEGSAPLEESFLKEGPLAVEFQQLSETTKTAPSWQGSTTLLLSMAASQRKATARGSSLLSINACLSFKYLYSRTKVFSEF
mmetsp:Transcript_26371/g.46698  ORF Transcript_26371/g.46698 Transcript_26371/m.46698 type:complete len:219 (+) Transcript_26371:100-756(+)